MHGLKEYAINTGYNLLFVLAFISQLIFIYILPTLLAYITVSVYDIPASGGFFDFSAGLWTISTWIWIVFGLYILMSFIIDITILINKNLEFEDISSWSTIIQSKGISGIAHRRP